MLLHEAEKRQKHQLSDLLTLGRPGMVGWCTNRKGGRFLGANV